MSEIILKVNLLHITCMVVIFQALLMTVILFTSERKKKSSILLGYWFFVFGILMICSLLVSHGVWQYFQNYQGIIFIVSQVSLLIGPLFFFYIKSLLEENLFFNKRDLIHISPFVLIVSYLIVRYTFSGQFPVWMSPLDFLSSVFFLIQNFFYYILIIKLISSYGISIRTFFLRRGDLRYNWIRFLIIGSFVIWLAKLQIFTLKFIFRNEPGSFYTATTYVMGLFLFFTSMVYLFLKKPKIFSFNRKYECSNLSEEYKKKIKKQLIEYMDDEKPYLDPDLKLNILAENLSLSTNYLSQIINEMFDQNFNDFVNQYRVQECIDCIKDSNNGHKTLLRIAFECGFNTKATFNSAFKKFTGVTPKRFRKQFLRK